jgi:hypothetical protein
VQQFTLSVFSVFSFVCDYVILYIMHLSVVDSVTPFSSSFFCLVLVSYAK